MKTSVFALLSMVGVLSAGAQEQKPIPVALDAFRQWGRWPEQRIGMRAYMRSTFDRTGGNNDPSHFLYLKADDFNVTLDVEGPGMLVFSRFNHWHGSPWHFVVDGVDHVIGESMTADPLAKMKQSTFLPAAPFPEPLNETWAKTKGADLIWSPVEFEHGFQMAYGRTHYGTGYYIYDQFVPGTKLSHQPKSWTETTVPGRDVLDLISRAGEDIAPVNDMSKATGRVDVPAGGSALLVDLKGAGTVRALKISVPRDQADALEGARIRVTWDGRPEPSIDAPVALFYGAGTLYNRDGREYMVKAFPMNVRFAGDRIYLDCYLPMPYFRSAHIELMGGAKTVRGVEWEVRSGPLEAKPNELAYLHATYRDIPKPVPGEDMVLADTRGAEGQTDWTGSFIGTSFIFSHAANLGTLEGDPRFFFDDSLTPQAQGTGTEEWGGGGDYWGGVNMTLAFAGHPAGARSLKEALTEQDKIETGYRFLLSDLMPFGKNAVIRLEHGGVNQSKEHYETVAYWYGLPGSSLIETDRMQVGDAEDEQRHAYRSPEASEPYSISSRYEWGPDTLDGKMIYPAETDRGRKTQGTSEFTLRVRKDNLGVMLRRKLDYSLPDQRAEVYVGTSAGWKMAGIWYLAGSNTVIYSNPKGELGATEHNVETSNRRFRDDEFLIGRDLTQGKDKIRVRVKFTAVDRPLFPGYEVGERAWSEIRYTAYSFVKPAWPVK